MSKPASQSPDHSLLPPDIVGVGQLHCAVGPFGSITTSVLGSGMALAIYDPKTQVGGILHYLVARPRIREDAMKCPAMYAVSGIPALFRACEELGAVRERLVVVMAGGAEVLDVQQQLVVGNRNRLALRKLLLTNGIAVNAEEVGGSQARRLTLELESGRMSIQSQGQENVLWHQ